MFSKRRINLQFQLGEGDFGEGGADTVEIKGLRCSANITKSGGVSQSSLDLRVWGMPLSTMNRLTVLNKLLQAQQRQNSVVVSAGDDDSGVAVCFVGTIHEAWADGRDMPDIMFHVSAASGLLNIKPVPPISFNGTVDVATVVSGIAQNLGLSLENSGVTGTIDAPYLPGSVGSQLRAIAVAAHFEYTIDEEQEVLAIWPKGAARGGAVVKISPDTGMIGYPSFTQNGVQVSTLFNPSLVFGRTINIESDFTAANGSDWVIAAVTHSLDADIPGGQWFTQVECTLLSYGGPGIIG